MDEDEFPDPTELAEEAFWRARMCHPDPRDPNHPEPEDFGLQLEEEMA
jgi:hypothetical protein